MAGRLLSLSFALAFAAVLAVAAIVTLALGGATPALAASPTPAAPTSGVGAITRVQVGGTFETATRCIAQAPDGNTWLLTEGKQFHLVRIGPTRTVTTFPINGLGPPGFATQCLTVDRDGIVWMVGGSATAVTRFDPASHAVTTVASPDAGSKPVTLAAAPDGGIWFGDEGTHGIGRIDRAGHVTTFPPPVAISLGPYSIAVAPDGTVWTAAQGPTVTDAAGNVVDQSLFEFSPAGGFVSALAVARTAVPAISISLHAFNVFIGPNAHPFAGWGTYPVGVAEIDPGPTVRQVPWPLQDTPVAMAAAADGRQWFATSVNNGPNYGYIDPSTLRVTQLRAPQLAPNAMSAGPGAGVSFVTGDSFLYVIDTGVAAPGTAAGGLGLSTLASLLRTPAEAFASPQIVATSAAIAAGGTLFITFPAQLFNLTFQENYATISGWWRRRTRPLAEQARRFRRMRDAAAVTGGDTASTRPGLHPAAVFAIVTLLGALLGSMLDDHFGLSLTTLTNIVATSLALVTGVAVIGAVTGLYHRRRFGAVRWHLRALPLGLLVAAVCVLISRALQFHPGYLYGVVCGVVFAGSLGKRDHGRIAALSTVALIVVSVFAWLAWSVVRPDATGPAPGFLMVLLDDFLAAVFVSGMIGTAIGLLPLRFLTGALIRDWRPPVWAALFGLSIFIVVDCVAPSPKSPGAKTAPILAMVLFVLFGGFAIGFREYFARRWRAEHAVTVHGWREHLRDLFTSHPQPPDAALGATDEVSDAETPIAEPAPLV
jgi:streptogramin lyase